MAISVAMLTPELANQMASQLRQRPAGMVEAQNSRTGVQRKMELQNAQLVCKKVMIMRA